MSEIFTGELRKVVTSNNESDVVRLKCVEKKVDIGIDTKAGLCIGEPMIERCNKLSVGRQW